MEPIKCNCGCEDFWLVDTATRYFTFKLDAASAEAEAGYTGNTDDGCNDRLRCRECGEDMPIPDGVDILWV